MAAATPIPPPVSISDASQALLEDLRSGKLVGTKKVKLSCGLTDFPSELFLLAESLEQLDLSGNALQELPAEFSRFTRIKVFFGSDNQFTIFPSVLAKCPLLSMVGFKANRISTLSEDSFPPALRWLILTNNTLEILPRSIGDLPLLEKLMLAGNRLDALPLELERCSSLRLLRISANRFATFPETVFRLPSLAWLAIAGNPFVGIATQSSGLRQYSWNDLKVEGQLGEGASGVIYKVSAGSVGGYEEPLALKVFKGEVTSDGFALDEMKAWLSVSGHPSLVKVRGSLCGHPEGKQGLLFAVLPESFRRLGDPPSFESCTRDVYPTPLRLKSSQALNFARGIASAMAHLHQHQVMHGDLYAHNIMVQGNGEALLGDFGAAVSYRHLGESSGAQLERIEVAAFGFLLQELAEQLDNQASGDFLEARALLLRVASDCLNPQRQLRPGFGELAIHLAVIAHSRGGL